MAHGGKNSRFRQLLNGDDILKDSAAHDNNILDNELNVLEEAIQSLNPRKSFYSAVNLLDGLQQTTSSCKYKKPLVPVGHSLTDKGYF